MATAESVKAKFQRLIDYFNTVSGESETTFVKAFERYVIALKSSLKPNLVGLAVTKNGYYTPSGDKDGFSSVNVNVPANAVTEELSVIDNGVYTPPDGVDGYNYVNVAIDTQSYYDQGYADGQSSVDTDLAYNTGYSTGYSDGHDAGYSEGYEAGRNSVETA